MGKREGGREGGGKRGKEGERGGKRGKEGGGGVEERELYIMKNEGTL